MGQQEESQMWGSSRSTPPSLPGRRYSSGAVNENTQDSGLSSPRQNRNNESSRSSRVDKLGDSALAATSVWRQERFESVSSMHDLLSSLALDRYKDLFMVIICILALVIICEIDLKIEAS